MKMGENGNAGKWKWGNMEMGEIKMGENITGANGNGGIWKWGIMGMGRNGKGGRWKWGGGEVLIIFVQYCQDMSFHLMSRDELRDKPNPLPARARIKVP